MTPAPLDPETSPAPPPSDQEALIRLLREELIKTQLIVLDLNDRVLEKETDKADAIAILARVELVLEQKIDYITELDRALNAQIADLRARLASAENESKARDTIIQDLVAKLDAANQEISRMHGVAGDYARDLNLTREALARESAELARTRTELAARSATLAQTSDDLAATRARLADTERTLADRDADLAHERRRLNQIFASALWRLGRPWRALFGPKV